MPEETAFIRNVRNFEEKIDVEKIMWKNLMF